MERLAIGDTMTKARSNSIKVFEENLNNLLQIIFALNCSGVFVEISKEKLYQDVGEPEKIIQVMNEIIDSYDNETITYILFSHIITIMEVYLKDRIIEEFQEKPEKIVEFISNYHLNRKITKEDVLLGPDGFATSILDDIIFHQMTKVQKVYEIVFGFDILQFIDYKSLESFITLRHEIVHRGNKDKFKKMGLSKTKVVVYLGVINQFILSVDYYIAHGKKRKRFPRPFQLESKKYQILSDWDEFNQKDLDRLLWIPIKNLHT